MGLFDDRLLGGESLFRNEDSLSPEWVPKLLPFREVQQKRIATVIKPLFSGRSGPNLLVSGAPGIGKTAAVRVVLRDLEEYADDAEALYVNCWQKNTTFKVYTELCHLLGYRFTQNKRTEDLLEVIKGIVNKKAAVFVFDEVDKIEDLGFLYSLLEEVYTRTIIVISNDTSWLSLIDGRVRSRLLPELLTFQPYTTSELRQILKDRADIAFVPGVWSDNAFDLAVERASKFQDVRVGLHVLKESGRTAEDESSKKVLREHAAAAIDRMAEFQVKEKVMLNSEDQQLVNLVKEHSGKRIGELFEVYKEQGGVTSYKTFQRRVDYLSKNRFISTEKRTGGTEGTTTILSYEKKLTEF